MSQWDNGIPNIRTMTWLYNQIFYTNCWIKSKDQFNCLSFLFGALLTTYFNKKNYNLIHIHVFICRTFFVATRDSFNPEKGGYSMDCNLIHSFFLQRVLANQYIKYCKLQSLLNSLGMEPKTSSSWCQHAANVLWVPLRFK